MFSVVNLFSSLCILGLRPEFLRRAISKSYSKSKLLTNSFAILIFTSLIGSFLSAFALHIYYKYEIVISLIASSTIFFIPLIIIEYFLLAKDKLHLILQAKFTNEIFISASLFLFTIYDINFFAISLLYMLRKIGHFLIIAPLFINKYLSNSFNKAILSSNFEFKYSCNYIFISLPALVTNFAGTAFASIDLFMLKILDNNSSVGIYSLAWSISQSYFFIFPLITQSSIPKMLSLYETDFKKYIEKFTTLVRLMLLICSVSTILSFLALNNYQQYILNWLGEDYIDSLKLIPLLMLLGFSTSWQNASWLLLNTDSENYKFAANRVFAGLVLNIILNYCLIPIYSVWGAVYATLISRFFCSHLSLIFNRKGRLLIKIYLRSVGFKMAI